MTEEQNKNKKVRVKNIESPLDGAATTFSQKSTLFRANQMIKAQLKTFNLEQLKAATMQTLHISYYIFL